MNSSFWNTYEVQLQKLFDTMVQSSEDFSGNDYVPCNPSFDTWRISKLARSKHNRGYQSRDLFNMSGFCGRWGTRGSIIICLVVFCNSRPDMSWWCKDRRWGIIARWRMSQCQLATPLKNSQCLQPRQRSFSLCTHLEYTISNLSEASAAYICCGLYDSLSSGGLTSSELLKVCDLQRMTWFYEQPFSLQ